MLLVAAGGFFYVFDLFFSCFGVEYIYDIKFMKARAVYDAHERIVKRV
jgi:hypothetical protein